jgi:hypothetical protein
LKGEELLVYAVLMDIDVPKHGAEVETMCPFVTR